MNKNKYIIIIILFVFVSMGCEKDLLITIPNDRVSFEIFWRTEQDAIYAANAIYTYLIVDMHHFTEWDAMSDIGHVNMTWESAHMIEMNKYEATHNRISREWSFDYEGI